MGNIHPLVVHFPIACLIIYTILEAISWVVPRWKEKLLVSKQILLFIGVLAARAALQTGEIAADIIEDAGGRAPAALDAHEDFAEMSYRVYGILALWYLLQRATTKRRSTMPQRFIDLSQSKRVHLIVALGAIYGSILLMITGALGGSMVFGPDIDPMVRIIYDFLVD